MELKKLDKSVLKLWYLRAAILSLLPLAVLIGSAVALRLSDVPQDLTLATLLAVGIPAVLLLCFIFVMPALRYSMYAWGYDSKRIIVKQGVFFRQRVVIPICQIQDLHRTQGPLMLLCKLSDVTISTAGSNFDLSTLTTHEADRMIEELEQYLEARIEEMKSEEI